MSLVLFLLAWFIFTFGPGIAITGRLSRDLDPLRRIVIALGTGTAATPLLINTLGRLGMVPAFPYLAVALGGVGLWLSRGGPSDDSVDRTKVLRYNTALPGDLVACVALVALAAGL